MRLIGSVATSGEAERLSRYLSEQGIEHVIEAARNNDWSSPGYGDLEVQIWIIREEDVSRAMGWFQFFQENPDDPRFASQRPSEAWKREQQEAQEVISPHSMKRQAALGPITSLALILCVGLFILGQVLMADFFKGPLRGQVPFFASPIKRALLYDYPKVYSLAYELYKKYGMRGLQNPDSLPPEGQVLAEQLAKTPVWTGIYPLVIRHHSFAFWKWVDPATMFLKIRQGQVWRMFTPSLLHADLFHLFFNMLWLFVLGRQLEQNLRRWVFILFIILVGIVSNTAQYLMSGANFLGFSGVLCGMLTFIWMRQRIAPWENYRLEGVTIAMLIIFILGMFALQIFFFLGEFFQFSSFSFGLANTAHITGGLMGLFLARLSLFSWKMGS